MHTVQRKSIPAHKGARFDSGGFCLAHPDISLCKLTAEGKYKTVRKICFKCGNAGRMTHVQKTKLHGYRKKSKSHRGVPSELLSAGDSNHTTGHRRGKKSDSTHRSSSRNRSDGIRIRGRTLSPIRKNLSNKIPNKIPNRPSSSSDVMKQKLTEQKIMQLFQQQPPIYRPISKNLEASSRRASQCQNTNRKSMKQPVKQKLPFDGNGHCRAHPEVPIAEKGSKGEWNIVSGVCPQCCVSAVLACQQEQASSSITDNPSLVKTSINKGPTCDHEGLIHKLIGKEVFSKSDDSRTQPTTSSSYPPTPESILKPAFTADYFTSANQNIIGMALDIQKGESMVEELTELNKLGISESTFKHTSREPPGRRL